MKVDRVSFGAEKHRFSEAFFTKPGRFFPQAPQAILSDFRYGPPSNFNYWPSKRW